MPPSDANLNPLSPPRSPANPEKAAARNQLVLSPPQVVTVPAARPPAPPTPSMAALFQALRRCWLLAVCVGLLAGVLTAAAVCLIMPAKYSPQARVKLMSQPPQPLFNQGHHGIDTGIWKANQIAIVKSPLVLGAAVDRLKAKYPHLAQTSVESLEQALKVDFLLGPEIMRLTLTGNDPGETAALVNAILDAYLHELDLQEARPREEVIAQLKESLKVGNVTLDNKRRSLHDQGIDDPQVTMFKFTAAMQRMQAFDKDYRDFKAYLGAKERRLVWLKARIKTVGTDPVPPLDLDREIRTHPIMMAHFATVLKNEETIAEIVKAAPNNKTALRAPLNQREKLKQEFPKLYDQLRTESESKVRLEVANKMGQEFLDVGQEVETLRAQEETLQKQVADLEKQVKDLDPASRPQGLAVVKLLKDVEQLQKESTEVKDKIHKLMAEPKLTSRVIRLQNAEPPEVRDYSRQLCFAGLGSLGMFLVGLLGVGVWELRNRKISALEEVTLGLGLNVVGTLPALPPKARRALTGTATAQDLFWQNRMAESVDAVRTVLLHASKADGVQVVMVTSALGGEGKTSLATQLATSLARAWRKTLLIDGDLRNPAAHKLFEVVQEPGLSEVLRGEADLPDAVRPTALSRLWLMPAGQWDAHAVQVLAQEGLATMFDHLKGQYDFIIVDSCPVLPVADSLLLAQHVDAVVFSILRDVSRMPAVQAAQQRLQALGIPLLGAVVIGASGDVSNSGYQYPAIKGK